MSNLKKFNARELASKHVWLMDDIEKLPPGAEISPERKAEIKRLQAELYRRLYSFMKGDVLPVQLPAPSKKDLEFIEHQEICQKQIEGTLTPEIIFNFDVISPLKTLIDCFMVKAPTKAEAWKEAEKRAEKYPGQVNLKIS